MKPGHSGFLSVFIRVHPWWQPFLVCILRVWVEAARASRMRRPRRRAGSMRVIGRAANRFGLQGVQRVGAAGGANGFGFDVALRAEEIGFGGRVSRAFVVLERPAHLGPFDLFEVAPAGGAFGFSLRFDKVGDGNGGEQADDGDDHTSELQSPYVISYA